MNVMTQEDWDWIEEKRQQWRTDDPEEYYWVFTDCQKYGWRAEVMFDHHDGPFCAGASSSYFKDPNVCVSLIEAARAAYADAFPGEDAPVVTVSGFTHKRYGWEVDEEGYIHPVRD